MPRLLLIDALAQIASEVLPADEAMRVPWISAVCQRFHNVGKWSGLTVRWRGIDTAASFAVYNDAFGGRQFTLPRNLLCLLAAGYGNSNGSLQACFSNQPIRGPWHEFSNNGYGIGDAVACSGIQDAGDGFCTFRDFTEDSYLRVKTELVEEPDAEMLFRGLDEDGKEIYSGTGSSAVRGVVLDISSALTTTTTQQFSATPTLIRKSATHGPVELYAVNVATAVETLIGLYEPGETSPCLRRYRVGGTSDSTTVHAMCKRRHVPAVEDADEVIPGNVGAIELGLHGRRYDLENDPTTAATYWLQAFDLLNSELGEHHGGASPRIQWGSSGGLASIPRV